MVIWREGPRKIEGGEQVCSGEMSKSDGGRSHIAPPSISENRLFFMGTLYKGGIDKG